MNGRTAPSEVNVDNALAIGEHMPQLQTFIVNLPDTFHMQIKKEIVTVEELKKRVNVRDMNIYNIEKICMQAYSLFLKVEASIYQL